MSYPKSPGFKASGTSSLAARRIAGHAKTVRDRVRNFLSQKYPLSFTADEIAEQIGENILTIRPRVSELNRGGEIHAVAERRRNKSGMLARCWRAQEDAS